MATNRTPTVLQSTTPPMWYQRMMLEAQKEAQKRARLTGAAYGQYDHDPLGFCQDVLGYHYTDDQKEIMRSVVDNTITIAKSSNAAGKTYVAAHIAVWVFSVYPQSQVYVTSAPPLENLYRLLWGEIKQVIAQHPNLFSSFLAKRDIIYRDPRSFLTAVTIPISGTSEEREAKFSGKHAPQIFFFVDEGDAVPDEVYRGIEQCMSGGMARLLVMFNPKATRGPVYEMENSSRGHIVNINAFAHPNVITGQDVIPGAVTRAKVVERINKWTRPLMDGETPDLLDTFDVPDFLVGTTAKDEQNENYPPLEAGTRVVQEPGFSYMVLGRYPAQSENQLISIEWINAARARYDAYVKEHGMTPPPVRPRLGLDVSEYGPDWNVPTLRYGGFVTISRRWNGVDPVITADRAIEICERHNVEIVLVDGTGYGSSVARNIARGKKGQMAMSIKVAERPSPLIVSELGEFKILRDQLWWAMREWLRIDPNAMLPNEPTLIEELKCPTYRIEGKYIRVMDKEAMREKLKRSPNDADSLALTFAPHQRARVIRLG